MMMYSGFRNTYQTDFFRESQRAGDTCTIEIAIALRRVCTPSSAHGFKYKSRHRPQILTFGRLRCSSASRSVAREKGDGNATNTLPKFLDRDTRMLFRVFFDETNLVRLITDCFTVQYCILYVAPTVTSVPNYQPFPLRPQ